MGSKRTPPLTSTRADPLSLAMEFGRAADLRKQGRLQDAERALVEILRTAPGHVGALHLFGVIAAQTGRAQLGVRAFETAVALDREFPPLHLDLGRVLASLGRRREAIENYNRAIALKADYVDAYVARGRALTELRRYEEARTDFVRAIELAPDSAVAHNDLGNVLTKMRRFEEALSGYDAASARRPNWPIVLNNRGIVLDELQRADDALASYGEAIALDPSYAFAYNNRGRLSRRLGRLDAAMADFDKAIALQPKYPEAHYNRGCLLADQRLYAAALASCDEAIAQKPDYAVALAERGKVLVGLQRYEEAVASYDRALKLQPDDFEAWRDRGLALVTMRRPEEAIASCDKAIALHPDCAEAHAIRGDAWSVLRRFEEAAASYDRAIALQPDVADYRSNRANARRELGRYEEALAGCEDALKLEPNLSSALGNKGMLLMELGRFEEAREALGAAISLDPRNPRLYYLYTRSTRLDRADPIVRAMEDLAQDVGSLDASGEIMLHFALAKVYSDNGDHEAAFRRLRRGNASKRRQVVYDEPWMLGALDRARTVMTREFIGQRAGVGEPSSVPVFVFGMPRSGTTLVEQVLASHPEVFGAGEIGDFAETLVEVAAPTGAPFPECVPLLSPDGIRRIGERYVERIRRAAPEKQRIVNKEVGNFRYAGLIHLALPNARLIHVRRDPMDVCLSCYEQLFVDNRLPYVYDLGELGRYYKAYERLMAHWRAALPPGAMLEVVYEDIVADREREARRLIAYCGLDWDPRCLDFYRTERSVRTASLAQVREPIYARSIGRWRRYEAELTPLRAVLRSGAEEPD